MSERTAEQIIAAAIASTHGEAPHDRPHVWKQDAAVIVDALADAGLHLCAEGEVPPWMEQPTLITEAKPYTTTDARPDMCVLRFPEDVISSNLVPLYRVVPPTEENKP